MRTLELIMLHGESGAAYPFKAYVFHSELKSIGAVFVITRRETEDDGRGVHNLLYVGQTEDLADSFSSYEKLPCVEQHEANCLCVLVDDDGEQRTKIESDLLKYYNPPCNN